MNPMLIGFFIGLPIGCLAFAVVMAVIQAGHNGERSCRVCGCTDERACPGGCYWVEPDLCSRCFEEE